MPREMTWREAIDKVMAEAETPMHYKDIAERIRFDGLRQNLGAKPATTVNVQISTSIKNDGPDSPYVRVSRGTYALKNMSASTSYRAAQMEAVEDAEEEEQYSIVTSFGMFWGRSAIEWATAPKLLGMQQLGATPIDFCAQLGIYLLYDGREVIYVGRATERSLGKRLYEHTMDRMSARWDRFSWFGLLPVSEDGALGSLPASYDAAKLIPAFEAVLIEALEPRQNRRRGDDLAAVEYIQRIDPEIEKKKARRVLDAMLNKL